VKKYASAWAMFQHNYREKMKKLPNPITSMTELAKEMGIEWKKEDVKQKWEKKYAEWMIKYWWDIALYNEKHGHKESETKEPIEEPPSPTKKQREHKKEDKNPASDQPRKKKKKPSEEQEEQE